MNTALIAVSALLAIALLALVGVLCILISGRERSNKPKNRFPRRYGKVFVRHGIDIRRQITGDGKGDYFADRSEEQPTCLADPTGVNSRLCLTNLRTGEELCAEFVSRMWIGRGTGGEYRRDFIVIRNDSMISRNHCVITRCGNGFSLSDLNSSNHTYLNDRQTVGEVPLKKGDIIRVGNTELRVRELWIYEGGEIC